jgi:hypothetical protein
MKKGAWNGGTCSTHGITKKCKKKCQEDIFDGTVHLGVLDVDHTIILKLVI